MADVKRKTALVAILLTMALSLSGCSLAGLDAGTLMRAPKPTGANEADIQSLLDQTAGDRFTLVYPSEGDNRSAILEYDVSGKANNEAVAFYQKNDETTTTDVVFMQKTAGGWKVTGTFSNQASQVDRVCFGDLNGDGRDETVVGWGSSLNNNSSICVYYAQGGKMNELKLNQNYSEMEVMDFLGDGRDEIFTACVTAGDQPAQAHLIRITGGNIEVLGTASLDTGVTRYASVKCGLIDETQKGVVLDGIKASNTMVTEVLYWDKTKKVLAAPFYDPATKTAKSTTRSTSVVSKDVNGDKIIELPIVTLMPGYTGTTADEADYLTSWHRYDTATNTFVRVMNMVIDYADGYWFSVPDMWRDKITTKLDPSTRSFSFYQWMPAKNSAGGVAGPRLLKIEVFTKKEWSSLPGTEDFFELYTKGSLVFAASRPSPSNTLSLTESEVKEAFRLIEEE
jgi:hypothetical protein